MCHSCAHIVSKEMRRNENENRGGIEYAKQQQSRQMRTKMMMNATLAAIRSAPMISLYSTIKSVDIIEAMHSRHGQDRDSPTHVGCIDEMLQRKPDTLLCFLSLFTGENTFHEWMNTYCKNWPTCSCLQWGAEPQFAIRTVDEWPMGTPVSGPIKSNKSE